MPQQSFRLGAASEEFRMENCDRKMLTSQRISLLIYCTMIIYLSIYLDLYLYLYLYLYLRLYKYRFIYYHDHRWVDDHLKHHDHSITYFLKVWWNTQQDNGIKTVLFLATANASAHLLIRILTMDSRITSHRALEWVRFPFQSMFEVVVKHWNFRVPCWPNHPPLIQGKKQQINPNQSRSQVGAIQKPWFSPFPTRRFKML